MKEQIEIPGTERDVIEELEDACERLLVLRAQKKEAAEAVADAEQRLQDTLLEHGREDYIYVDGERRWVFSRERVVKTKVAEIVKRKKRGEDDDDLGDVPTFDHGGLS